MYKNNIYVVSHTSKHQLMMVVYDPINDIWNKFDLIIEKYKVSNGGRLIIADDCLFLA